MKGEDLMRADGHVMQPGDNIIPSANVEGVVGWKRAFTTQSFMYGYVSTSTRNYARPKVAKYVVIAWLIFLFCHVLSKNGVPQQTNILPRLISILSIIGWWP